MEPKLVKIPVWDCETDEFLEMEVSQDYLDAEEAEQRKLKEGIENALAEEMSHLDFLPDDDY
jgi:hypothetical protein